MTHRDAMAGVIADVIVVGLGTMGSAALLELARRGVRVVGIDRFSPPHDRGSGHGGSRVIRLAYFEHSDYVPLLRRAYEGFERLERDAGVVLKTECGVVMGGTAGNPASAGMLRSARAHGLEVEHFDGAELMRRYPQFSVPRDWEIVREARGGFVRPEATIRAALAEAERLGARIVRNTPITRWESDGHCVRVFGGAGSSVPIEGWEAGALVLSSGAWMPGLSAGASAGASSGASSGVSSGVFGLGASNPFALRPTRETLVWMDDAGDRGWHAGEMPVWFFDRGSAPPVYGIPAFDGMGSPRGLKVGLHGRGPDAAPESIGDAVDPAIVAETSAATAERIPIAASRAINHACHCMYTMSTDGHFVVGLHPKFANVAVACGFSGHGFKFAPVIGEALADLAVDGRTALPIGFLAPHR
jgi:glycine/D-amino acid oxidase-like deaminating enzyme